MVRGGKNRAGHRGSDGLKGPNVRGSRDDPWDPMNPEEDLLRDLRVPDDEGHEHASDEYVWPQFDDEDDD